MWPFTKTPPPPAPDPPQPAVMGIVAQPIVIVDPTAPPDIHYAQFRLAAICGDRERRQKRGLAVREDDAEIVGEALRHAALLFGRRVWGWPEVMGAIARLKGSI